jgi:hypothetical protein
MIPIGSEAGWEPEPVWTLWNGEESLAPADNRTTVSQQFVPRYSDELSRLYSPEYKSSPFLILLLRKSDLLIFGSLRINVKDVHESFNC